MSENPKLFQAQSEFNNDNEKFELVLTTRITLLDLFAAFSLAGRRMSERGAESRAHSDVIAEGAYNDARSMLAAREREKNGE